MRSLWTVTSVHSDLELVGILDNDERKKGKGLEKSQSWVLDLPELAEKL